MGIQSPNDAWRLAQKFKIRKELAIKSEIALDDLTRATRLCWNGCPECIHRLDIVLGGNYGMPFLDKAVLDLWYRNGRQSSNDYHDVNLDDLAAGTANLQFGITHNVTLDINDRRLRSSLLPWTIGLDIQRSNLGGGVGMLVRESDIHLHRSVEMTSNQDPIGVPSIGVKRLLWFDLVMTAYLDASGRLDPSNRTIDMVYYDIRDIEFEDGPSLACLMQFIISGRRLVSLGLNRFPTSLRGWFTEVSPSDCVWTLGRHNRTGFEPSSSS